jgi:thioredoxin-dependent peroxiredoxin
MATTLNLKLKEGDPAPDFTAPASNGGTVSLSDFKGKHVVLYFYPRDDTPGCTKEACGFRDAYDKFKKAGAVVLGVSIDPVKAHDKFISKFKLPFTLVADEDKSIVEKYGVWGQKSFMGRKYMGTHRVTFLIDPHGRIKKIWPTVKPEAHSAEVLAALA